VLILGRGNAAFEVASNLLRVTSMVHLVGRPFSRIRLATETHYPGDVRRVHSNLLETYLLKSQDVMLEADQSQWVLRRTEGGWEVEDGAQICVRDEQGRELGPCPPGRKYDHVISCPGWHFDTSPFDAAIRPALGPNGKHPALTADYGAPGVAGLHFLGTAAHAADFRVSSGGFIHGFRYTVRALHRLLEEAEASDGQPGAALWPRTPVSGLRDAVQLLLLRCNQAAGIFQMFSSLADVLVLPPLLAADAAGFTSVGTVAPLLTDASFTQPRDANAGAQEASDAAIDRALRGVFFEEVPTRMAHIKAAQWAPQVASQLQELGLLSGAASGSRYVEYITLTLEFGNNTALEPPDAGATRMAGQNSVKQSTRPKIRPHGTVSSPPDPYSLDRTKGTLTQPELSTFLHPVFRYHHSYSFPASGVATGAVAQPALELHLLEDFRNVFDSFPLHILPLARWLQDVGARRAAVARSANPDSVLSRALHPPLPLAAHPGHRVSLLQAALGWAANGRACTELHYDGHVFPGGSEAWLNRLSVAAWEALARDDSAVSLAMHDLREGGGELAAAGALRRLHTWRSMGGVATLVLRGEPKACGEPPTHVRVAMRLDKWDGGERYVVLHSGGGAAGKQAALATHTQLLMEAGQWKDEF
jgi:hypothetical protein